MVEPIETTECKWCERSTTMVATKVCPLCWELQHRINGQPQLAFKMLVEMRVKTKRRLLEAHEGDELKAEIERSADRELTGSWR